MFACFSGSPGRAFTVWKGAKFACCGWLTCTAPAVQVSVGIAYIIVHGSCSFSLFVLCCPFDCCGVAMALPRGLSTKPNITPYKVFVSPNYQTVLFHGWTRLHGRFPKAMLVYKWHRVVLYKPRLHAITMTCVIVFSKWMEETLRDCIAVSMWILSTLSAKRSLMFL